MNEFEILEHTADIGMAAYGKTKKEVFINGLKLSPEKTETLKKTFMIK